MAEDYTLIEPEVKPEVVNTKYKVIYMMFSIEQSHCAFNLLGQNGERLFAEYGGPLATPEEQEEARKFIKFCNTANFSTNSMQKRILQKLGTDGKIPPGTVTGTPDPPTE